MIGVDDDVDVVDEDEDPVDDEPLGMMMMVDEPVLDVELLPL